MKTDKELLILAAKAACNCIDHERSADDAIFVQHEKYGDYSMWNPLTDDGDALRLAVDLGIAVRRISNKAMASSSDGQFNVYCDNDKHAATRRAIVRAAAAIGEAME